MDYVYICRSGENEELRYSIRSLIKNAKAGKIWVVGNKPDWYSGNFIPVKDIGNKYKNIQNCLSIICDTHEISENFILMNDDFYFTKPVDKIETYHDGLLSEKLERYVADFGSNQYSNILADAYKKIVRMGTPEPINYDVHLPMIFNRFNLKSIVNITLAPRSLYGNHFHIGGIKINDVKLYNHNNIIDDIGFLSSEDNSFPRIAERLQEMFPEPSEYERISLPSLV